MERVDYGSMHLTALFPALTSTMIEIRSFQPEDFSILLDLANQAVPFAVEANIEWLAYRRAFDESQRLRRHYIATDNHNPVGYGCLEQQGDDPASLRIYIVCSPQNLREKVGSVLYTRLLEDAKALGATMLWARELQADESACRFFAQQGLVETQRLTVPNFAPVVIFQLSLAHL